MAQVPLGRSDYRRGVADEPDIKLVNRYFETNPTNQIDQVALIARPGLRKWLEVGDGPIRGLGSQPGSFDDALFVVSRDKLFRIDPDETVTELGSGIFGTSLRLYVDMAITARIGGTPEYLFLAAGRSLWIYTDSAKASGTLTASGAISSGDEIKIGSTYYQWTSGDVDNGTPDGSSGSPWLVALGSDTEGSLDNMRLAIEAGGTAGTTYTSDLTEHPDVEAPASDATTLAVEAKEDGTAGNSIATTVETGTKLSWGDTTLTGGGSADLSTVSVPDNLGVVSVAFISGFVICVVAQGQGFNGRFYWINPGETRIDPLNFATAERAPDPVWSVRAVGDQFWLFGSNSTEVWYPTGEAQTPFRRVQGRLFDRGIWQGTDATIRDSTLAVDREGVVYQVTDAPRRVSTPGIEERIREAMVAEQTGAP